MTQPTRRRFLGFITSTLGSALALCLAIPAVAYFCSPLRRKREAGAPFLLAGPVADLRADHWNLRSVDVVHADGWKRTTVKHAVWIRREESPKTGYVVLSSTCPHLGCPINWHTDKNHFQCPCHGGTFDASGKRTAGPPPRGMDRLDYEVRGEHLWVRWQDFKIGTSQQVIVNA